MSRFSNLRKRTQGVAAFAYVFRGPIDAQEFAGRLVSFDGKLGAQEDLVSSFGQDSGEQALVLAVAVDVGSVIRDQWPRSAPGHSPRCPFQ